MFVAAPDDAGCVDEVVEPRECRNERRDGGGVAHVERVVPGAVHSAGVAPVAMTVAPAARKACAIP